MNVKDLLTKRIEELINSMEDMDVGSDEYKKASEALTRLLDKLNEMDRNDYEYWDKEKSREMEKDLKLKQLKSEQRDHIVKNCLTAFTAISGIVLTVWGTKASFEFEKTGSVTTIMGRGFINNLLPKKQN